MQERYNLLSTVVKLANSATLSYPARLKSLARFFAESFQLVAVTIYILDRENRFLVQKIPSAGPDNFLDCLIPLGDGVAGRCAKQRALLQAGKDQLHDHEFRDGRESQLQAIPIADQSRVCGVITLGLMEGTVCSAAQLDLLQDMLPAVAGLIRDMEVAERSSRRVDNLTILSELGKVLNKAEPPRSHLSRILQTCHKHSAASCTVVRLLPDRGLPAGLFKKCRTKTRLQLSTLLELEADASARVQTTGISILVTDLIADEDIPPSYLCVPLRFEAKMLGSVTFFGKLGAKGRCQNFDEEDRELFDSMAMLVSNALAGSATYQQMVQFAAENDKKVKELSLLYRISNTMLSTINLNKLTHLTLTALTAGANPFFERAMLFLINEKTAVMQGMLGVTRETAAGKALLDGEWGEISLIPWDMSEEEMARQRDAEFSRMVRETRLPLDKTCNVSSKAVLEKRLVYVADVEREKRVDREFVRRFAVQSFAAAPLMAKQQVVGVLVVDNSLSGKAITPEDLRFLQLFTNQAGMAIENSMLYSRIEDAHLDLREAQEQIIQGERLAAIGEMAASIAHELKNPLVSIGGFAKRLEKKIPADLPEHKYAGTIVREVTRLEKMLSEVLSFSKKATICYMDCDISGIIEDSLAVVSSSLEESGIRVSKSIAPEKLQIHGDCQQLKQVFINLFFNAQEAMKSGGVLQVTVAPATLGQRKALAVKVSDSGGGIPLEILNNIFNPFFTTKASGTGLGLAIVHRIITNHGGKIEINNRPGIGAEFTVTLPLHP